MEKLISFILLSVLFSCAFGQTKVLNYREVIGVVVDNTRQIIIGAAVKLFHPKDKLSIKPALPNCCYRTPTIVFKSDTAEYRANNYAVRPNAAVEDLAKKMDGMEVDKEGSISLRAFDL